MEIVDINRIVVSDRARKVFDPEAVSALADSIKDPDIGLIHALSVAEVDNELVLVAGERRLQALSLLSTLEETYKFYGKEVPIGSVPVEYDSEPTLVARLKRELDENGKREAFTWQEASALTARIAKLTQKKYDVEHGDTTETMPSMADLTQETMKATAEKLFHSNDRSSTQRVRQDLELASAMEDEQIAVRLNKAKTKSDATKILKKVQREAVSQQLAQDVGAHFKADKHRIEHGDCLELLKLEDVASYELCITDPPYGMNAHTFGDSGGKRGKAHNYDDTPENWALLMPQFVKALDRVMKADSHIYLACDIEMFFELKKIIFSSGLGWQIQRTPLIQRNLDGRVPIPEFTYRRMYECWLYARKGKKQTNAIVPDVIDTGFASSATNHSAAKSKGILETFFVVSGTPGQSVIDPFAGTGTVLPVAHNASMYYTGFEIDKTAYGELITTAQSVGKKV